MSTGIRIRIALKQQILTLSVTVFVFILIFFIKSMAAKWVKVGIKTPSSEYTP
jgi:hypothetical protein